MEELPRGRARPLRAGPAPRRADRADLAHVVALWIALTRHHEAGDPAWALRPAAEAEVRSLLEAQLRDPDTAIFLAGDDAAPVGLAIARVSTAPPIHAETQLGEITDLYVAPAARRRGLGRALLDAASAWAVGRGAERLEVRVVVTNPSARAFWQKAGFTPSVEVLSKPAQPARSEP